MTRPLHPPANYPLTPVQTGMLFQSLWRPQAGFYVQQLVVRFKRTINPEILRQSWNCLTARHDSLRAFFAFVDPTSPRQLFAERVEVPFHVHDWSALDATSRRQRLADYLGDDRKRAFALESAPLMRIALFRCGPAAFTMVWTSHHLLFDGRSRYLILRELAETYQALEDNRPSTLPPAPAFRDFLLWIEQNDFSVAENYWRSALEGVTDLTPVGDGSATGAVSGSETRQRHVARFSPNLLRRLEGFSEKNGFTLNTLFQAAWAVVLNRYSGREDIVFGAPRAGRNCPLPHIGSMVGVFVNTLPVRVRVSNTLPVLDFLHGIRENWVTMRPFEQTPLRSIHGWCRLPEGQSLFDSLVGFEAYQLTERLSADEAWWTGAAMELDGWTNFALTVQAYRGSGIELVLTFDPARFTPSAMRRLGGHLRTVLSGFVSRTNRTVGDLNLLTPAERREVLVRWNATEAPYPRGDDVASVFSHRARASPDATALILNEHHMSYGELDRTSDAVAAYVQAQGVGRGDRVGVLMERSFAQVQAILGIMKAGAAYVPLDAEYPRQRLGFMLGDAAVRLVLGDEENRAVLDGLTASFATVGQAISDGLRAPRTWQPVPPDTETAAYVMYTSGSTGTPKGVVVSHRGILRLVLGVDYVDLRPARTLLHMAPASFDASTFELWGALLQGARCVLYPFRRPQIRELDQQIATHGVDTLWLTAALFNFVIDEAPEILLPVRQLLVGGEALSPAHVAKALARLPDIQIINGYGPTETTTFACCHRIPRAGFDATRAVPIGRPISNTTAYVLDGRMQPVPVGVEGELFLGGPGVALGYLNRPELTAERFVRNPFATAPGPVYRTGDLVCWNEDGLLEFRGRTDDQVKIRGHRIEPDEIARVLQGHPAVQRATVLAIATPEGKELRAFFTLRSGMEKPAAELRAFLAGQLPSYLIPTRFFAVREIPMTINGKVDRGSLLRDASTPAPPTPDRRQPTTALGWELALLWNDVLGVKEVSVDDSFFSLGGNSLSALRLIHRLHQKYGVEIPLHVFFAGPTLAHLEEALGQNGSPPEEPSITSFRSQYRGDRWLLNPARADDVKFTFRPENLCRRTVVRKFHLTGNLDRDALVGSIRWVAGRHEALSTRYVIAGDQTFQVRSVGECPVQIRDLTDWKSDQRDLEVRRILHEEETRPFDPEAEWMHRYMFLVLAPREHVLILCFHHANFDGTSLDTFYRELSARYRELVSGEAANLPASVPQQNDVHAWLGQWLNAERKAHSRDYWRKTLEGVPSLHLPLAVDQERPNSGAGRIERLLLDAALAEQMRQRAREHGVTLFQLFLAGMIVLVNRVGSNHDIAIGISVDLRTHGSLKDTMGCLVSRLTVRAKLADDPSIATIVEQVAERMKEALPHRYLPIDDVHAVCASEEVYRNIGAIRFTHTAEQDGLQRLAEVACTEIPREGNEPLGILSVSMKERSGRVELLANHLPWILPTETVQSMLGLYHHIITVMASGRDPHLSELPRLGGASASKPPRTVAKCDLAATEPALREILSPVPHPEDHHEIPDGLRREIAHSIKPENRRRRNIVRAFRLAGDLKHDCFIRAIQWVVSRHEALHTRYAGSESSGYRRERIAEPVEIEYHDLHDIPVGQRLAAAHRIFDEECASSFDPAGRWLHGFRLLRLEPDDHVFIAKFHHLNFDGASLVTFYRELSAAYQAFASAQDPDLAPPPVQSSDLLAWLEGEQSTQRKSADREFWQSQLAGIPVVRLPLAKRAAESVGEMGRTECLQFEPELVARLEDLARRNGVTLYALFLAGLNVVVHRVTGLEDVPIGIATDRRPHIELAGVMGNFANMVLIRADLRGSPSFSTLLQEVWMRMRNALAHRYLSSYELAGIHQFPPDPLLNPLRMIWFIKHPDDTTALSLPDLRLSPIPRKHVHPAALLSIQMKHSGGCVELHGSHIPGVLPTAAVQSMFVLFREIMRVVSTGLDPALSAFPRWEEAGIPSSPDDAAQSAARAELTILALFRTILHQPKAGPVDSFFELGGHSLLATLLLHRIEQSFGISVPHHVLFENPTARKLAASLASLASLAAPAKPEQGPPLKNFIRRPGNGRQRANLYTKHEIGFLRDHRPRNIMRAFHLRGPLLVDCLGQALQWVAQRHEALRTRLVEVEPGEYDREVIAASVRLAVVTIAAGPAEKQMEEVDGFLAAEANRLFGVDSFPLHAFTLLHLAEQEHVLVFNFHHIFFDGKSLPIFLSELSVAYTAYARRETPKLPDPPFQLNDVMLWTEDWLNDGGLPLLHAYWRNTLSNLRPLRLPTDLTPTDKGVVSPFLHRRLGEELTQRIRKTAMDLGTTFHGFTQSAANALLYSFGNHSEIHAGILCCMRRHPEAEGVVGHFGNLVVARTNVEGDPSFQDLVARTRRSVQEAIGHRGLPFLQLRSLAPPASTCDGNPFQFYFIDETTYEEQFQLPGIALQPILRRTFTPTCLLGLQIAAHPLDTTIRCMARPEYFSASRIKEILDRYEHFLHAAVENPERRLSEFLPGAT